MSDFTQGDLDNLCRALRPASEVGLKIALTNSFFELAKQHSVIWPVMACGHLDAANPLVSALQAQTQSLAGALPAELIAVNQALRSVSKPIYLKGAAILIEHDFAPQTWRYMADFDMLVEPENLSAAVGAVEALGYSSRPDDIYQPRLNPHYPILLREGAVCGIEIHTRLLQDKVKPLLNPKEVRARAETIATSEGPVLIASIYDRLIHLIAHAQIGSHRYQRRQFLIRDALEFDYLLSRRGADYGAVKDAFERAGKEAHFDTFTAMAHALLPNDALTKDSLIKAQLSHAVMSPRAADWIVQTRQNILSPKRQNRWIAIDWARIGIATLFFPTKWVPYLKTLKTASKMRQKRQNQLK